MIEDKGLGPKDDWEADWEGAQRRQLRMDLMKTPAERVRDLERLLVLAYEAGALQKASARKQADIDKMWADANDGP